MGEFTGKICSFCKAPIGESDEIVVCQVCGMPHHKGCWDENKGCTTFGCSEQHYEPQGTNISDVCAKCGTPLGNSQDFCSKCGTRKGAPAANVCGKCGATMQDGQEFCPKCGQKIGLTVDAAFAAKAGQFNQCVAKKKNKKPLIFGLIGAAVVVIVILAVALGGGSKVDFSKMFADYKGESWCTIASDGSYMEVDTNPNNTEDYNNFTAYDAVKKINEKLGFSEALYEKMGHTTSLQGRQTDENDKIKVSWTFHPDKGMEIIYERK